MYVVREYVYKMGVEERMGITYCRYPDETSSFTVNGYR